MLNMKKLLALLVTAGVAVSAYAGEFKDISINEVNKLAESKSAVIIDVNGDESFKAGHVADSDESGHLFQSISDTVPGLSDSCRSEATL